MDRFSEARRALVEQQLEGRGIRDPRVLDAFRRVPRERFMPDDLVDVAYDDQACPIGYGQTISQPYIVALMAEALAIEPQDPILDIGTGSGYAAAILAELGATVYSIEYVAALADRARQTLSELGYDQVHVRTGDGREGWPEHAPFGAIHVAAVSEDVPPALLEQLGTGGRLVLPLGPEHGHQELVYIRSTDAGSFERKSLGGVRFVPLEDEPEETMSLTRAEARAVLDEMMDDPALRAHVRSVEIVMEALAPRYQGDPDRWAIAGLLHDADYQRWPEEHPQRIVELLEARGEHEIAHAISCHYTQWGVACETDLDRALLATDELTGFIVAVARVRPNGLQDLTPKSVKKKLKDKSFAKGVERSEVEAGITALGVDLTDHIAFIIETLRPHQEELYSAAG